MVDTVNFQLNRADMIGGIDLLELIPLYLDSDSIRKHDHKGNYYVTGRLGNYSVTITEYNVSIKDGSLCKYLFGDNMKSMGRAEIQRAIEKLSDSLHIPMDIAKVTRLDVANNIILKHPAEVYFNHLGMLPHYKRLVQPDGLYYKSRDKMLVFYDKIKEQHGKPIPELCQGHNVLRYEQRYVHRLGMTFKTDIVRASDLYEELFYINLLKKWRADYNAISKINDITANFSYMKTKKQFDLLGRLAYIEQMGGELAMLEQITLAQKRGELTPKQAHDLRQAVKESCKVKEGLTVQSDAINELNKKIAQTICFYR